jgi:hypothetical protein
MDPIQEAIEFLELREAGNNFLYRQVAKMFGVEYSTLAQRHQGQSQLKGTLHRSLHSQQETELIQYIKGLTEQRLPPTRTMIRNFASSLARKDISDSWVTCFLNRNSSHLISRWQTGMDRKRHKADSGAKYSLYFELLHNKIREYSVEPNYCNNAGKTRDPNLAWSHSEAYGSAWENRTLGSIDTYRSCTKGLQKTAYLHLEGCNVKYTKAMKC